MPSEGQSVVLGPHQGRRYDMGAIQAVFKADRPETLGRFSISEWWLDARHEGPGAHKHDDNDEIFYVIEGTASILVGDTWHQMAKGSLCVIPRGTMHDFRNESASRMGLLNVYVGGPFEEMMPMIVDWYRDNPAKRIDWASAFGVAALRLLTDLDDGLRRYACPVLPHPRPCGGDPAIRRPSDERLFSAQGLGLARFL